MLVILGECRPALRGNLEYAGRFAIDASRRTIMDLRRVTMMDSVGLSFVIRLAAGRAARTPNWSGADSPPVVELVTFVGGHHLVRCRLSGLEGDDQPYAGGA